MFLKQIRGIKYYYLTSLEGKMLHFKYKTRQKLRIIL